MQFLKFGIFLVVAVSACSNILITPGASEDSSAIIGYAADSSSMYGKLGLLRRADHPDGAMKDVHDWDSGKYLGKIREAKHTYNVVGNMNEFQLTIGETTFGGLSQLFGQNATMDYGTLIWTTLQRARTAREAIQVMGELVAEYGYASEGESFSIADTKEVWVLEMIGKGPGEVGAVWVAVRIPDGHVCAHANQARIRTFPLHDKDNAIYSPDVISFARKLGLFSGADEDFSFSDIYDPVTEIGARICEARVWSFFRKVNDDMDQYLDYLQGRNLSHRMPLSVPVNHKISLNESFWMMRNHNEHSWFDDTSDVGAGPFHAPYRWRPVGWQDGGKTFVNERTVATQQTGWHFIAQSRSWLPNAYGGIIWFSVDDAATGVHVPMYSTITAVPKTWGHPEFDDTINGDITKHSFDSAFWVFNMVANLAYTRWDSMYPEIAEEIVKTESLLMTQATQIDFHVKTILKEKGEAAVAEYLTQFCTHAGDSITKQWLSLWQTLFVKYRDGQITTRASAADSPACGCVVNEVGYDKAMYDRIIADTGDHYEIIQHEADIENRPAVASKLRYA